jgi:hypothetical protein
VAPAWDRSGDLQSGYLYRVFDSGTLYFILYYNFHRFYISGYLSFYVIHVGVFSNVHKILLYSYIFFILH